MSTEIIKPEDTSLQNFGGRDPIKEMALRIQTMMPNAQRLATNEAMAVAQLAFAHGLDPFNGEVWGIKRQDTGQWYGVMVGIKGLRKSARREAKQNDSDYLLTYVKVDPRKYDFQAGDVVYECHLRDVASFQAWTKIYIAMVAAKIDKETIELAVGPAPVVIGVGKANSGEKSKMELHARAKKRAEADALKQKYDLNFGTGIMVEGQKEVSEISEIVESSEFGEPIQDSVPAEKIPDAEIKDIPAEQPAPEISAEEKAYIDACTFQVLKEGALVDINTLGDMDLQYLAENGRNEAKKNAARVILNWRDAHPKRTVEAINGELGF